MASTASSHALTLLFVSYCILSMASLSFSCPTYACEKELNLRVYLHQVVTGQPNNNEDTMVRSPNALSFGSIAIHDWPLLDAPAPNGAVIAHAKGMHAQSDIKGSAGWFTYHSIVFEDARFTGSTLLAMGMTPPNGQWGIVAGTGEFANAHGIIKHTLVNETFNVEIYRQLDIHAFYTPETVNLSTE
uniref:Uncharacterized protein n=1 Tax=Avena sativa TaxID=4498 RepID=A0ACD5W621_AVESA